MTRHNTSVKDLQLEPWPQGRLDSFAKKKIEMNHGDKRTYKNPSCLWPCLGAFLKPMATPQITSTSGKKTALFAWVSYPFFISKDACREPKFSRSQPAPSRFGGEVLNHQFLIFCQSHPFDTSKPSTKPFRTAPSPGRVDTSDFSPETACFKHKKLGTHSVSVCWFIYVVVFDS